MSRTPPNPIGNEETDAFWEAARDGELRYGYCRACQAPHFYPRGICPHCHSAEVEQRAAAGTGEIYTYSVTRRTRTPYAIAYVTLDEGVTLMTNIIDCDLDAVTIGQRVEVAFVTAEDGESRVPCFRPC